MPSETTIEPATTRGDPRSPKLTCEEFLRWNGKSQHVEWVNGEVIEMSPVSKEHADVGGFLSSLLRSYAEAKKERAVSFATPSR